MRGSRLLQPAAMLLALLCAPLAAQASCTNMGDIHGSMTILVPPTLSIPRDKYQVGNVIWSSPRLANDGAVNTISCDGNAGDYEWGVITAGPLAGAPLASGSASPSVPPPAQVVYQSSVPGIGVSISFFDNADNPGGTTAKPVYAASNKTYWNSLPWTSVRNTADYQVKLIKTGPISAGVLRLAGTVAQVWYGGGNAPNAAGSTLSTEMTFSNDINVSTVTCAISNPTVTVALPKVANTALPATDTAAGSTPFNIDMVCSNTKVSYRVDATQYSGSYYSLIVPTGSAKGVAVQLLDRSTTPWSGVYLNTKTLLADATNSSNVAMRLPFAARYYRPNSGVALQPGTVTATATLTMFYE